MKRCMVGWTVLLCVCAFAWAFAGETSRQGGSAPDAGRPHRNAGDLLGQYFHDNMAAEVLSEISGKKAESFRTGGEVRVREALAQNGISENTFRSAMDAKTILLAKKAVECGLITSAQAADLETTIKNRPARPQEHVPAPR